VWSSKLDAQHAGHHAAWCFDRVIRVLKTMVEPTHLAFCPPARKQIIQESSWLLRHQQTLWRPRMKVHTDRWQEEAQRLRMASLLHRDKGFGGGVADADVIREDVQEGIAPRTLPSSGDVRSSQE